MSALKTTVCTCLDKFNIPSDKLCVNNTDYPACLPATFGISCAEHDNIFDPECLSDDTENIPAYCSEQWCYVDYESCLTSPHLVEKSVYFNELGLYYSYTVCNGSSASWDEKVTTSGITGKDLVAAVPATFYPYLFKRDSKGNIDVTDEAYWNNDLPWEGVIIDYIDAIFEESEVGSIKYTHRSLGSSLIYPESSYTATVNDVSTKIADFGAGDFWMTADRLKMSPFSVPYFNGKINLWVPSSRFSSNSGKQLTNLAEPFTIGTWVLLFFVVISTSLVGVWLTSKNRRHFKSSSDLFKSDYYRNANFLEKLKIAYPKIQDFIMMNFTSFFSDSVEFQSNATYPFKLLMIGFAFFVMISYSAYVANLAAFLITEAQNLPVSSMKDVISEALRICAPSALEHDLKTAWPDTKFVFNYDHSDHIQGMIDYFDENKCEGLVVTVREIKSILRFYEQFCERKLVATKIVVKEEIMAFPATAEVAPGLSYKIAQAHARGIYFKDFHEKYNYDICPLEVTVEVDEMNKLEPKDMLFPVIVFFMCLVFAIIWQVASGMKKKGKRTPRRRTNRSRTTLGDFSRSVMNSVVTAIPRNASFDINPSLIHEHDSTLPGNQDKNNTNEVMQMGEMKKNNNSINDDLNDECSGDNSISQHVDETKPEDVGDIKELILLALRIQKIAESIPDKKYN